MKCLTELHRRGLLHQRRDNRYHHNASLRRRHDREISPDPKALKIWRESTLAAGSIIETKYLQPSRGISISPPPSLRYSNQPTRTARCCPPWSQPCKRDRKVIAVQITWVDPRHYKRIARSNVGELGQGAVRLAAATEILGLAEGTETALAAMQLHRVPVWAALGRRLHNVAVPDMCSELQIFGDNDQPGRNAAEPQLHITRARVAAFSCISRRQVFKDWAEVTAATQKD